MMKMDTLPRTRVGGFQTVAVTREQLARQMVDDCFASRQDKTLPPKLVFSSNGQGIALAGEDPGFLEVMEQADIIHADGMSVVTASRLLTSRPLPERIATTDFFHDAAEAAQFHGLKFFILGGHESQNAAAAAQMSALYPGLHIVGRRHGYFGRDEDETVCQEIVASGCDVLWVGLGKPHQERWCVENRRHLAGVGWMKTCGGLYAFLAGDAPRAPNWMQAAGLEWLFRTMKEPRRLAWRYLTTNPHSIYRMIRYSG